MPIRTSGGGAKTVAQLQASLLEDSSAIYNSKTDQIDLGRTGRFTRRNDDAATAQNQAKLTRFAANLAAFNDLYTQNSNDYYSLIKNPAFVATLIHLQGLKGRNNEEAKKAVSLFSRYALVKTGEANDNEVKDEILQVSDKSQMALGLARFYVMAAKNAQEFNQNPRTQPDRKIDVGLINSATERATTLGQSLIQYHTKSEAKQKLAQDVLTEAGSLSVRSGLRSSRPAATIPAGAATGVGVRRRPSDAAAAAVGQEQFAGPDLLRQVGATTRARQGNEAAFHTAITRAIIPSFARIVPQAKEDSSDEEAVSPPATRSLFDRLRRKPAQSAPQRTKQEAEGATREAAQEIRNGMVDAVSDLFKSDDSPASTNAMKARLAYRNENENSGFDEILDFISAQIKEEGRGKYSVDSSSASNIQEASLFLRRMLQAVAQLKVDGKIDDEYINDLLDSEKLEAVIDKLGERNMVKLQDKGASRFMDHDRVGALGHAHDLQRALNVLVHGNSDQLAQFAQSGVVAENQYVEFSAGAEAQTPRAAAASAADAEANPYRHIYEVVSFEQDGDSLDQSQDGALSGSGLSDGEENSLDGLSLSDVEGMTLATDELQNSAAKLARLLPVAAGTDEQTIDINNGNNEATRYRIFHANQVGAVTRNYVFDAAGNPVVISFDRANNGAITVTNLLEDSANQAQQEVIDALRADYLATANAQIGQIELQAAIKLQAGLRGGLTRRNFSREKLYNFLEEGGFESPGVQLEIRGESSIQSIQGNVRYYGEQYEFIDEGGQEVNVQYGIISDNRGEEVEGRYPYPAVVKSVGGNVVLVTDKEELREQSEVIKDLLGRFKQDKRAADAQQGGQDLGDFSEGGSAFDELDAAPQGGDGVVDQDAADAEGGELDNNDFSPPEEEGAYPDSAARPVLRRANSTSSIDSRVTLPNVVVSEEEGGLDQPADGVRPDAAAGQVGGDLRTGRRQLNPRPRPRPQHQTVFDQNSELDESEGEEFSVAGSRKNSISSLPDGFHVPRFAAGAGGNPIPPRGSSGPAFGGFGGGGSGPVLGGGGNVLGHGASQPHLGRIPLPTAGRIGGAAGFGAVGGQGGATTTRGSVVGGNPSGGPTPPNPPSVPAVGGGGSASSRGGAASFSAAGVGQVKALSNATKGNIDVSKKTLEDLPVDIDDNSGRPIINAQNSELLGLRQNQQKNSFANFGGLIIKDIDFGTTNLWMANFRNCDLRNCDFSKIPPEIFNTIKFHGCNIENSRFPQRERGGTVAVSSASFAKNDVPQQGGVLQEAPNLGISQLANYYSDFLNTDKDQRDVSQLPLPNNSRNSGVRSAIQRVSSNVPTIETPNTEVAQARAEALDRGRTGIRDAEV